MPSPAASLKYGAEYADALERLIASARCLDHRRCHRRTGRGLHRRSVPPKGYLQRLRELCTKHDILLIFDEVITGFGRLGAPFASQYFDVKPDLMTMAKAINNATVPMGAVAASARDLRHHAGRLEKRRSSCSTATP